MSLSKTSSRDSCFGFPIQTVKICCTQVLSRSQDDVSLVNDYTNPITIVTQQERKSYRTTNLKAETFRSRSPSLEVITRNYGRTN
jgi:hypothetical protein